MQFKSILKEEINSYLQVQTSTGQNVKNVEYVLLSLDRFIHQANISEKILSEKMITSWCKILTCKASTKRNKISVIKNFAEYLNSLGNNAFIPEIPRTSTDYVPYVFSEVEWLRIIDVCDNLTYGHSYSSAPPIEFPLLVRMLYGCGLRLNEALSLQIKDIDLDKGTLTIRHAKRNRQRIVPMSKSLTEICRRYCLRMCLIISEDNFMFPNYYKKPYSKRWAQQWFEIILKQAMIPYERTRRHERGPCLHCLRHTFTFRSFAKAEAEGHSLDDSVPFLSTYLGHENIFGTDKYLKFSYELYPDAHKKISNYTADVFPEVTVE